ncbi:MAG: OmpA family protein [Agriterribacter sp.]
MAFNLLNTVSNLFNSDLLGKAASAFGENENDIQKAVSGAVPSVLTGLLSKADSTDGLQSILNVAKNAGSSGILSNLSGLLGSDSSSFSGLASTVSNLFGDKFGSIANLISGFSGVKQSSASSLLNIVAPAALGVLGKHASENNLSTSGLASFLSSQKDSILSAIPTGLNIAGALGLGSLSGIGSKLSSFLSGAETHVTNAAHTTAHEVREAKKPNWLIPAILAIAAFALLLYIFKGCGGGDAAAVEPKHDSAEVKHEEVKPATVAESVRESLKVKLPDGTEIDAYKGGIEDVLVAYLNSNEGISKEKWFDFDDLNFETGSATITAASLKQVQNIAAILKAFPKVKIKIGGYTDNTGDSVANVKLSQLRADAVFAKLKELGSEKQLDGAEGYGPTHFVAPNDTEENKKKNRRISVNVRAK